jgi:hypothetical protein
MVARVSDDSNLDGDDGQLNAPIQQQIFLPSIQMIMVNAAGKGGREEMGGGGKCDGRGEEARPAGRQALPRLSAGC